MTTRSFATMRFPASSPGWRWVTGASAAAGVGVVLGVGVVVAPVATGLVVLGVLVAGGALGLAWRWPRSALTVAYGLVLIGGTKFRSRDAGDLVSNQVDLQILFELAVSGLVLFLCTVAAASGAVSLSRLTRWEKVLLTFAGVALASTLWSAAPMITLVRAIQLCILATVVVVSFRSFDSADEVLVRIVGAAVAYVLFFSALAVVFPWASGGRATWSGAQRFSWFAVHPITASTIASTGAVFLWTRFAFPGPHREIPRKSAALLAGVLGMTLVTAAAISRGPLFALLGALACVVVLRLAPAWMASLAAVVVLGIALLMVNGGISVVDLLEAGEGADSGILGLIYRGQSASQLTHLTGRLTLWHDTLALVFQRPLHGYGYLASRALLLEIMPWAGYAHNALIQTLLDFGLVGTVLLWAAFVSAALPGPLTDPLRRRSAVMSDVRTRACVVALMAFFTLNSVTSETFAGAPSYEIMLVFACVLAAERLRAKRPERTAP